MSQLRNSIMQHKSVYFFQKLFKVIYGIFDRNHNLSIELEEQYMKKMNLHYTSNKLPRHSSTDKDCLDILAIDVKFKFVRYLQIFVVLIGMNISL